MGLIVEFYRMNPIPCMRNDNGQLLSSNPNHFPYGDENTTCGIPCSTTVGPFTKLRTGSAYNIYLVPEPSVLNRRTGMLLSAGCCIPAMLLLVATAVKSLRAKSASSSASAGIAPTPSVNSGDNAEDGIFHAEPQEPHLDEKHDEETASLPKLAPAPTRKQAYQRRRRQLWLAVHTRARMLRRNPEALPIAAALLAVLIVGEQNFWSAPVKYQVETMLYVGKFAVSSCSHCQSMVIGPVAILQSERMC